MWAWPSAMPPQRINRDGPASMTVTGYVGQVIQRVCRPRLSSVGTAVDDLIETFRASASDEDLVGERAKSIGGTSWEFIEADEPTVEDTPISEYPLEIVDERGKEFAVVLTTGGPHIEVVADGGSSARLAGYWGGEQVYMYGNVFDTFLDYFIERD